MDNNQKKINETVRELKSLSLRFKRQESFILSLDIHDPARRKKWHALKKERNSKYRALFRELYWMGVDAGSIHLFY